VTQFEIGPHILTAGCLLLTEVIRLQPTAEFKLSRYRTPGEIALLWQEAYG
jgi:hypothetical protein